MIASYAVEAAHGPYIMRMPGRGIQDVHFMPSPFHWPCSHIRCSGGGRSASSSCGEPVQRGGGGPGA